MSKFIQRTVSLIEPTSDQFFGQDGLSFDTRHLTVLQNSEAMVT